MRLLTAGWVANSRSAARENEPHSATATKVARVGKSIGVFF